jgi:bifunctional non-homologous end joining protein LigD
MSDVSNATLRDYSAKRDFKQTPEPEPSSPSQRESDQPIFLVQKHDASRLHYDFRLEVEGVLKSWAVPKGPSLDPADKKLAAQVEDHPFDYRNFEGVIPENNYGAGTVMLWDDGTYEVEGASERAAIEKTVMRDLQKGHLHLILHGQKLVGKFSLVRMKKEDKSWLLIKKDDAYATIDDILTRDRSVRSGRSMQEIRDQRTSEWHSDHAETPQAQPSPTSQASQPDLSDLDLSGAERASMPTQVEPMLASLAEAAFDRAGWFFEIKWDGFRGIAETHRGSARLYSRHNLDYADEFAPIVRDLEKLPFEAVLDGEIVVVDDNGRATFELLQEYRDSGKGSLLYYVYDLLYLEGFDLQKLPLERRKAILKQILPANNRIRFSNHVEEHGIALYKQALAVDVEGVIAKSKASLYRQGARSDEWLKIKTHRRQEAVIGGFTEPRGGRKNLGALLLGVYDAGDLIYVGHTGGGFDEKQLENLHARLQPLVRQTSPFKNTPPKTNAPATWVEPQIVCEIRFADWTFDGVMRQPVFMGLREDREARQVRREKAEAGAQTQPPKRFIPLVEQSETIIVEGHEVKLTHTNKVFWPEEGFTKGEVIQYYRAIAPLILPHLIGRPESLHRYPNGIQGNGFFQKDFHDELPEWVKRVRIESETHDDIQFIVCDNEATLVYLINLGAIELNPWFSRVEHLDYPDLLLLDLDPNNRAFDEIVKIAQAIHRILDEIEAPSFCKTSGQRGLHIIVPLGDQYTYAQAREFAHLVMRRTHELFPEITSLERVPEKRHGKIYLDYLQNRRGQTMAAAYSLRPRPHAPVSTPLTWEEVAPGLNPVQFNLHTVPSRVESMGDAWRDLHSRDLNMEKSLGLLQTKWSTLSALALETR